ncbi:MAG TPA: ferritin family protein [Methanoregulaceae archaeon]|nr:ferritin family protein [Methanoregulaceae archaeon]HPD75000.1 ferritin family protein [Methanoregulaceae archaeon]HRY75247.1 ferritin family protein [Methanoregulaceae archaeon]
MAEFVNPFSGKVPDRTLTESELIRALRLDLAAEHEAVHTYMAHADATENPLAKAVLVDIANEERVHAGEFARLISILTGDEDGFLAKGAGEVDDIAGKTTARDPTDAPAAKNATTIGSLR